MKKKSGAKKKTSEAVLAPRRIPRERLDLVEKLWLEGKSDRAIQRAVVKRFVITFRTARRYLRRVRETIGKRQAVNPDAARARTEAMLLETYALAKRKTKLTMFGEQNDPDTKTMATVATRLGELEGAFAPKELKHTVSGSLPLDQLSDEALAQLDEAAKRRAAK
jgi:hypothetical protein